ncbi:MAG: hypothetical protein ACYDCO_25545 [Armatimonadota bacterium]
MPEKYIGHLTLEFRNFARLREYRVDLRSGVVTEASGGNGQGKTTLLTGLKSMVTGKPVSFPDWIVTTGEDGGTVKATFDDQVTARRDLRAGETASALSLYDEHGDLLNGGKKQVETLRALFGDGTYLNPVEVVNMRPGDRTKAIATALPIDPRTAADALAAITGRPVEINTREQIFPAIQQAHDSLYELRRQKHVAYKDADAQADGVLSFLPAEWLDNNGQVPAPKEPEPLGDIYDRKKNAEIRNGERAQLMLDIAELEEIIRNGDNAVAGHELKLSTAESNLSLLGEVEDEAALEEQIRELQRKLVAMQERNRDRKTLASNIETARNVIAQNKANLDTYRARLKAKQDREFELGGLENIDGLQATIDAYEDQMTMYREALKVHGERTVRYQQIDELRQKSADLYAEWEALDKQVKAIDNLPLRLLEDVPVPIPGMQIMGEDIFLPEGEGKDTVLRKFDAFGDADKLRFAARMAIELAPVNILLLDGVEKCDEDRRLELYRMAAEAGFITFSTRVTKGPLDVNHLTIDQLGGETIEVTVGERKQVLPVLMEPQL